MAYIFGECYILELMFSFPQDYHSSITRHGSYRSVWCMPHVIFGSSIFMTWSFEILVILLICPFYGEWRDALLPCDFGISYYYLTSTCPTFINSDTLKRVVSISIFGKKKKVAKVRKKRRRKEEKMRIDVLHPSHYHAWLVFSSFLLLRFPFSFLFPSYVCLCSFWSFGDKYGHRIVDFTFLKLWGVALPLFRWWANAVGGGSYPSFMLAK